MGPAHHVCITRDTVKYLDRDKEKQRKYETKKGRHSVLANAYKLLDEIHGAPEQPLMIEEAAHEEDQQQQEVAPQQREPTPEPVEEKKEEEAPPPEEVQPPPPAATEPEPEPEPIKEEPPKAKPRSLVTAVAGTLEKFAVGRSGTFSGKNWKTRHAVAQKETMQFTYHESAKKKEALGTVPLTKAKLVHGPALTKAEHSEFEYPDRDFMLQWTEMEGDKTVELKLLLRAPDPSEQKRWIDGLTDILVADLQEY